MEITPKPKVLFAPNIQPEETYEDRYWELSAYTRTIGKAYNVKYYPGYAALPIQSYIADIISFLAENKHIAVEENYKDDQALSTALSLFSDVEIHIYKSETE